MKTNGRQDISEDKHFSVILQLAVNFWMHKKHALKYSEGAMVYRDEDEILI